MIKKELNQMQGPLDRRSNGFILPVAKRPSPSGRPAMTTAVRRGEGWREGWKSGGGRWGLVGWGRGVDR